MDTFEYITVIIQTLSTLAIVVTMIFIFLQAKSAKEQSKISQRTLEQSVYLQVEASLLELSKALINNPEIVPFLYDNKKIEDEENKMVSRRAFAVAILYLDMFDHVLTVEKQFPGVTDWSKQKWTSWMLDMFKSSPILCEVISKQDDWYKDDLRAIAERAKREKITSNKTVERNAE